MAYEPDQRNVRPQCTEAPSRHTSSSEPTVFIVDDDRAVRDALHILLTTVGLNVATYHSAQAFLEAFDPARKGCLVLDLRMPGMSGLELQAQLAARGTNIPIILLTGHADVPTAIRAFKAGAMDLIEKPFDNQTFLNRIKSALAAENTGPKPGQDTLFLAKELAHLTLASIGDGVISTNATGTVEYLNPMAEYLTGWSNAEARGSPLQHVFSLIDETTREPLDNVLDRHKNKASADDEETRLVLVRRDGREFAIDESVAPIRDAAGQTLGVVIIFHDATHARQLSYHASHDPLTGLVNRREFENRLARLLANTRAENTEHALCYLDLDRFKIVNDIAGHAAGDQLLRQLSVLLHKKMRKRDTLARLGGDEFVALLEHCPIDQAARIANELCKAVQDFRFIWEGRMFCVGVSIGVTTVRASSKDPGTILQIADAACYKAKEQGRGGVHIVREHPSRSREQAPGSDWAVYLSRALQEDLLRLYRQATVPVGHEESGEHFEVLLRMERPGGEPVPASSFIPAAERANLAPAVDRWVIHRVLQWLADGPERVAKLRMCAINLSRQVLEDKRFLDFLIDEFEQTHVPPAKLCFELAETTITGDPSAAVPLMEALNTVGCRIAVDDFASTPSGFTYLRHLPVDFLKIDGALVRDMLDDPVDFALVKSINEIAHAMGIRTVAKLVENAAVSNTLHELEVDYLQGYYVARPAPLEAFHGKPPTSEAPEEAHRHVSKIV